MTDVHSKESYLVSQPNLTEQKLENSKIVRTKLEDFIERETRAIGRRLESQSEPYSPKCVTCGGVGRHLRVECSGVNWTRVVQAS
jgi:hypothetical protein